MAQFEYKRIVDLSYPVDADAPREMPIGPPKLYHTATMAKDGYFESRIDLSGHCSTHIDTPSLMYGDGYSAEGIDVERLAGEAALVDVSGKALGSVLDAAAFQAWEDAEGGLGGRRIAFVKTGMEAHFGEKAYNHNWIGLNGDGAQWLVDRGVQLVGTDACAIESVWGPRDNFPAHHTFLGSGIPIVENLRGLDALPNRFFTVVSPMKLSNSSGSPARVFAFL